MKRVRKIRTKKKRFGGKNKLGKLKKACLAAGLATAWGGDTAHALDVKLSITPNRTIMNALVYYNNGVTAPTTTSLGTLPANQTTTILDSIDGPFDDEVLFDTSFRNPGYVLLGRYEEGEERSVVVSFPNDDAIVNGLTWDEVFAQPDPFCQFCEVYSEEDLLDSIPQYFFQGYVDYFDPDAGRRIPNMVTYFNHEATIVGFSEAAFTGTILVQAIPEPSSLFLIVCGLGVLLATCTRLQR